MAKLDTVPNAPGQYCFQCDCGHTRGVVEAERFFACERPVEAKVPACKLKHEFAPLQAAMEKRSAEAAAKKFLAENEVKVAAAKAVLGVKTPSLTEEDMAKLRGPVLTTQSDVETKVVKRGPGRPKKESK